MGKLVVTFVLSYTSKQMLLRTLTSLCSTPMVVHMPNVLQSIYSDAPPNKIVTYKYIQTILPLFVTWMTQNYAFLLSKLLHSTPRLIFAIYDGYRVAECVSICHSQGGSPITTIYWYALLANYRPVCTGTSGLQVNSTDADSVHTVQAQTFRKASWIHDTLPFATMIDKLFCFPSVCLTGSLTCNTAILHTGIPEYTSNRKLSCMYSCSS